MQEKVLNILKQSDKALDVYYLQDVLGLKTVDELKELIKCLNGLEEEYKIYRTKKDKYVLFENSHLKVGKLMANRKGFGFVDIDGEEDVFIAPPNMNDAIHGDKVVVEITSKKGIELEGRILKVLERSVKQLVGEYVIDNNCGTVKLDDDKLRLIIEIDKDKSMGAMPGHKVLVAIGERIKNNVFKGEVIRILGHKNDPGVDILSIVSKYNIKDTFDENTMVEVNKIADEVLESELKDRRDLRDKMIFTIDGDDTKDIDDAISIEKKENGTYLLGVHIADVSHYVCPNTALDDEAYTRGTSVYLADRVIPMLPHKLSNGICSLNPNTDRLAISCEMEIDNKGNIINYDIFESVINSKKQMTYKCVNMILEKNTVPDGYETYASTICLMHECSLKLRENKIKRGYLEFGSNEVKIIVDDNGKAIDILPRIQGMGEKLIEDFMIAANETVANHIFFMELPFIYRVHGEPSREKIGEFVNFLHILGYTLDTKIRAITPLAMQEILNNLRSKKEFNLLSDLLLRSMQKAVYSQENIGHFGLGSKCYTHFTSPIRRYPDLTVHRLLRAYLFKNKLDKNTINFWETKLPILAEHTSFCERTSVDCEREVDDMKKAEYMMDHIGEEYTGIVSSVLSFGMFVELPNFIEGLVKVDTLKGGNYYFDEELFCLKCDRTKKMYRLGDSVKVRVVMASKIAKTIDFEIIEDDTNGNKQ